MRIHAEIRGQGEQLGTGFTKRKILIKVFNHPEGIATSGIKEHLRVHYRITNPASVNPQLITLRDEGYIIRENLGRGTANIWYPIKVLDQFKALLQDTERIIWVNTEAEDALALLSSFQGQEFIKKNIVPAFVDKPVSNISHGTHLFSDLPDHRLFTMSPDQFSDICIWAFTSCPLLISHFLEPKKEVSLCLTMVLNKYLDVPPLNTISNPRNMSTVYTNISKNLDEMIRILHRDLQDFKVSKNVSKELICILTMLICIFMHIERNPQTAQKIYYNPHFRKLWNEFTITMKHLDPAPLIVINTLKVMFTMAYTRVIFDQTPAAPKERYGFTNFEKVDIGQTDTARVEAPL
jgi:hypothetical protein